MEEEYKILNFEEELDSDIKQEDFGQHQNHLS
jgi:hypothetical protein